MTFKIKNQFVKSPNINIDKFENKQISIDKKQVLHNLFQGPKLVSILKKIIISLKVINEKIKINQFIIPLSN